MPQKLNKAGKMQDYIPAGNGDPSGEYGTSKGTNKNFTASDKKKTEANVISENKSVVVGDKKETKKGYSELEKADWGIKENEKQIKVLEKSGKYPNMLKRLKEQNAILEKQKQELKDGKRNKIDLADDGKEHKTGKLPWEENKANIINDDLTGKKYEKLDEKVSNAVNNYMYENVLDEKFETYDAKSLTGEDYRGSKIYQIRERILKDNPQWDKTKEDRIKLSEAIEKQYDSVISKVAEKKIAQMKTNLKNVKEDYQRKRIRESIKSLETLVK